MLKKITASLLAAVLVLALVMTAHAANESTDQAPVMNPRLMGLYVTEDTIATPDHNMTDSYMFSLATQKKAYLDPGGYIDGFRIDHAVSMLDEQGNPQTYFIASADDYSSADFYLMDKEEERLAYVGWPAFREPQGALFAAAPLAYQNGMDGSIIAVYENTVSLLSLKFGQEEKTFTLPETVNDEVVSITPRSLIGSTAEYYIMDSFGVIWQMSISLPSFTLKSLTEITDTRLQNHVGENPIYFDGNWLYVAYYNHGTVVEAISPLSGARYEILHLPEGEYIYDLYETDATLTVPALNPNLMALYASEPAVNDEDPSYMHNQYTVSLDTLEMTYLDPGIFVHNYKIQDALVQLDEYGDVQTYFISRDGYINVWSTEFEGLLTAVAGPLQDPYTSYAAVPLVYQAGIRGQMIGACENEVSLCDLSDGNVQSVIILPDSVNVVDIAPKMLMGTVGEYYVLDTHGTIWTMSISFPDFKLVSLNEFIQTGKGADCDTDAIYFDGSWIYRTSCHHVPVLDIISPLSGMTYEYGNLYVDPNSQDGFIYGLYEENTIPGVAHGSWSFEGFEWTKVDSKNAAFAVYRCNDCGMGCRVRATLTKDSLSVAPRYTATVSAEQSMDGVAYSESKILVDVHRGDLSKERVGREDPIAPPDIIHPIDSPIKPISGKSLSLINR